MSKQNKTVFLKFRITNEQKEQLKQTLKINGLPSFSIFFRKQIAMLIDGTLPKKKKNSADNIKIASQLLKSEIDRVGNNINQITRKVNSTHGASDLKILIEKVYKQQQEIMAIVELTVKNFENYIQK